MTGKRKYELKKRAERLAETRRRITEATVELHRTVGPAATQINEVARRAGVQRMTVYNHFPDESSSSPPAQRTDARSTRRPTWSPGGPPSSPPGSSSWLPERRLDKAGAIV